MSTTNDREPELVTKTQDWLWILVDPSKRFYVNLGPDRI